MTQKSNGKPAGRVWRSSRIDVTGNYQRASGARENGVSREASWASYYDNMKIIASERPLTVRQIIAARDGVIELFDLVANHSRSE